LTPYQIIDPDILKPVLTHQHRLIKLSLMKTSHWQPQQHSGCSGRETAQSTESIIWFVDLLGLLWN